MSFETINLICHADWSVNPRKRWAVMASLLSPHHWYVHPPIQVIELSSFFSDLKSQQHVAGCILAGFDFPIGLPYQYALKAHITDFLTTLPLLGQGVWSQFYDPAEIASQISLQRPFYPLKPGNSRRSYLEQGLDLPFSQLYRLCETAHLNRRAACPLFWTLGGQQVGKAAITGWKHLLTPALAQPSINLRLWPFSGAFAELCQPGNLVVVETYPAEFYGHLGILIPSARMSKRKASGRLFYAEKLLSWSRILHLDLDPKLSAAIMDGFGGSLDSEDRFDALVGLYGMINVIQGNRSIGEPLPPLVSQVEGWIFGQEPPERGVGIAKHNE